MTTTYNLNGRKVEEIAAAVRNYLESSENMETQCFITNEGAAVLQAKARGGAIKQFVGLDRAITVRITPVSETHITVDIGEGKWVDKGIALTVSWFVLWPLAVTSGVGLYKQHKLPQNIMNAIRNGLYGYAF